MSVMMLGFCSLLYLQFGTTSTKERDKVRNSESTKYEIYKRVHTHTLSLKKNEDKGLGRPWPAVLFIKLDLMFSHMYTHKVLGPWVRLQTWMKRRRTKE